jgi:microcystin-dependent protein
MSEPFLSEIKIFSFSFAPKGWALCNGQLLPISQNTALFSLLGTTYGGDGRTTFGLPNLKARIPMHVGNGHTLGESDGSETVTLTTPEMPAHTHSAACSNVAGANPGAKGNVWAPDNNGNAPYSTASGTSMAANAIGTTGGGQPHPNVAPFEVLNFCIALQGIFPSQN